MAQHAEDCVRVGGVPLPRGGWHPAAVVVIIASPRQAAGPDGLARGHAERVDELVRGLRHEADDGLCRLGLALDHLLGDESLTARAERALQAAEVLLHRGVVGSREAPLVTPGQEHHQEGLEGGAHHLAHRHGLRSVGQHGHEERQVLLQQAQRRADARVGDGPRVQVLVQGVARVEEDQPVRGDLGDGGDRRLRGGAGAVEAGAGGEGRVEGVEVGEHVVERVEAHVEALCAAADGRARGVVRAAAAAAGVALRGLARRQNRLLPETEEARVLVAPCQRRERREVALLRTCVVSTKAHSLCKMLAV
jgi:hypothetical protein